jgi:hypothetical protein
VAELTPDILFDPLKIVTMDASVDPRDPRYVEALKVLLDLIRKECKINAKTRLLVSHRVWILLTW